jgi:hypothetical protein
MIAIFAVLTLSRPSRFTVNAKPSLGCEWCLSVVETVNKLLESDVITKDIQRIVLPMCNRFSAVIKPLCEHLVTILLPEVLKLLKIGVKHLDICHRVRICGPDVAKNHILEENSIACDMCTMVVDKVAELIKSGFVEKEIVTRVLPLCKKLPGPITSLCENLVKTQLKEILKLLSKGFKKLEICAKFKICKVENSFFELADDNAIACDLCTSVVKTIQTIIESEPVKENIEKLLLPLCDKLGQPTAMICQMLVKKYLPEIIKFIDKGIEKLDICTKIKLCKPESANFFDEFDFEDNTVICDMCLMLITSIQKLIEAEVTKESIEKMLMPLCDKLGQPTAAICQMLVKQYLPQILKYLEEGLGKLDICARLKFCPKPSANFHPGFPRMPHLPLPWI